MEFPSIRTRQRVCSHLADPASSLAGPGVTERPHIGLPHASPGQVTGETSALPAAVAAHGAATEVRAAAGIGRIEPGAPATAPPPPGLRATFPHRAAAREETDPVSVYT